MNVGIDAEGLFAMYADWIAFLREKRATFEGQLAKMQGKDLPGKDASDQPFPKNSNAQATDAIPLPAAPQITAPSRKEKKTKTTNSVPVLAGTPLSEEALLVSGSEIETPPDEKAEEIPEWLWQAEPVSLIETDKEETPSSVLEEEDIDMDDWM